MTHKGDELPEVDITMETYDGDQPVASAETPYLPMTSSEEAHARWLRIQSAFVDSPQASVAEAHKLVSDLMQAVVESFANQRNELEQRWAAGQDVSTEELRVCLQQYRAFFARLLPSVPESPAARPTRSNGTVAGTDSSAG